MRELQEKTENTSQEIEMHEDEKQCLHDKVVILEKKVHNAEEKMKSTFDELHSTKLDVVLSQQKLEKFIHGAKNIDKILCMGKTDADKRGLGYEEHLSNAKTPQIIRASCFKLIRLEKVAFRSLRSMLKVPGTTIYVGGAMSMALLKGQKLLNIKLVPQILVFNSRAIDSCGGEIGNNDVVVYQSESDKSSFNNGEDCSGGNGGGRVIKNGRVHESEAVKYAAYRASTLAHSRVRESPLSFDTIFKQSHASLFNPCIVVLVAVSSRLKT
ncbi:hypothetical protein GIB67_019343 [Kingdonia uniflora]|uniref:Uncharacterized protein n=1 Tax=Kingdonia uniflora TaxID=39325 RepID=A0A7J7M1I1_9MAGN|nr:hypothetical protein GIB67_019343 [Kingdonia uniflora]